VHPVPLCVRPPPVRGQHAQSEAGSAYRWRAERAPAPRTLRERPPSGKRWSVGTERGVYVERPPHSKGAKCLLQVVGIHHRYEFHGRIRTTKKDLRDAWDVGGLLHVEEDEPRALPAFGKEVGGAAHGPCTDECSFARRARASDHALSPPRQQQPVGRQHRAQLDGRLCAGLPRTQGPTKGPVRFHR